MHSFSTMESAPLFYADQFIEATFALGGHHVYGAGQRRGPLMIDAKAGWTRQPLWAADHPNPVSYTCTVRYLDNMSMYCTELVQYSLYTSSLLADIKNFQQDVNEYTRICNILGY